MFPLASTERNEVPDDEATLKRPRLEVDVARTVKTNDDDVALIPATTPLSTRVDVPRVDAVIHREAYPNIPPDSDEVIPRDDVAVHTVEVPVERRTIPRVPEALPPSRRVPVRLRLGVKRLVAGIAVLRA
jgi:hypothetical protein